MLARVPRSVHFAGDDPGGSGNPGIAYSELDAIVRRSARWLRKRW